MDTPSEGGEHALERIATDTWNHGMINFTNYAGGRPDNIGADIAYHERDLARDIIGLRVHPDEVDAWRHFLPRILAIVADEAIPSGCGYMVDHNNAPVVAISYADVRPWEEDWDAK
jgi:hypothetical protein